MEANRSTTAYMWGIRWWQARRLNSTSPFSNHFQQRRKPFTTTIPNHSYTMDRSLDRSLDDILGDRKQNNSRGPRGGGRRRDRSDYPRDGVRKVRTHNIPGKALCHPVKKYKSAQIWPSGENADRLIEPSLLLSCSSPRSYSTWFERRSCGRTPCARFCFAAG
jgi:hypothetical protein